MSLSTQPSGGTWHDDATLDICRGEMMRTVLFLDIDGVLSIPNTEDIEERKERWPNCGVLWPIPIAMSLLRAIEHEKRLQPVWLSTWCGASVQWNILARTSNWPVAYHLSRRQEKQAQRLYPEYTGKNIDRKLIAARYYMRQLINKKVTWIEDGFADETKEWASSTRLIKLIDTTDADIRTFLLSDHAYHERASREFIERWL